MNKIMTGSYNPLPTASIVLVGVAVNEKPNFSTIGFVSGVNIQPAIVAISLNKMHLTTQGILENQSFSLNIPSTRQVVETDYCGLVSGRQIDKSTVFEVFYGAPGGAPMIQTCPITCECHLIGQPVEFEMDTVFFGEVTQVYVDAEALGQDGKIQVGQVRPLLYSGFENRYRALGDDLGAGWNAGRAYQPPTDHNPKDLFPWEASERPAQSVLSVRKTVPLPMLPQAITEAVGSILRYCAAPTGPLFVAYHGFDGQAQEVEIGFPCPLGAVGGEQVQAGIMPAGWWAQGQVTGSYDRLPQARVSLEYWLAQNGYTKNGPVYEFYLNDPQITAPSDLKTEMRCQIEPK